MLYSLRLYNVPNGKIGKDFTKEVAVIFEDVLKRKCNIERLMVLFPVILQKAEGVKELPGIRKRISLRLAQLREGKFKGLVEDTHQLLKAAYCNSCCDTTPEHRARVFDSKV